MKRKVCFDVLCSIRISNLNFFFSFIYFFWHTMRNGHGKRSHKCSTHRNEFIKKKKATEHHAKNTKCVTFWHIDNLSWQRMAKKAEWKIEFPMKKRFRVLNVTETMIWWLEDLKALVTQFLSSLFANRIIHIISKRRRGETKNQEFNLTSSRAFKQFIHI